jgi:hypothetical protein
MLHKWTCMMALTLGCLCFAAPTRAQDQENYNDQQEPQANPQPMENENPEGDMGRHQQEQRDNMRNRGPRTVNLDRLERAMKKDLDLDEDQLEAIEALFDERRAEYAEELAAQKDRMYQQREKMGEFLEQIREARRNGDREAEEEINDQIRTLQDSVRVEQITDEFLQALENELYEDQIEKFHRISAIGRSRPNLQEAVRERPGMLKRYVTRLDLDEDTSDQIEQLYEDVQEDMRSGQLSVAERRERANEFYEQVMELLDQNQKARLMKFLGADNRRSMDPRERARQSPGAQDQEREEGSDYDQEGQQENEESGQGDEGSEESYD